MGLSRAYTALIIGLAIAAGAAMALIMVIVVQDVIVRNVGLTPWRHSQTVIEYGLLYVALLAGPWLIRRKGHIHIELIIAVVPARVARVMETVIYVACTLACLTIAWAGLSIVLDSLETKRFLSRSFDTPAWTVLSVFPFAFTLMAIEFARYLFVDDTIYERKLGIKE